MRFTKPAIAPPPYKVEAEPLITSTCFKSSGGICNKPNPLAAPAYSGNPSFKIQTAIGGVSSTSADGCPRTIYFQYWQQRLLRKPDYRYIGIFL